MSRSETMPLSVDAEHEADLLLLVGREEVDDAVDRLGRVDRVQRREDEVADLGRGQRRRDGLVVAHLADEDDVGVLADDVAQRVGVALGVDADLALVDDAALVLVQDLDRVLDGDDVTVARAVDVVDHRRERRRLARAGGAGHEHEPARLVGELADDRRQAELLDARAFGRHPAQGHPDAAALAEHVDAEATDADERVGEVDLAAGLEASPAGRSSIMPEREHVRLLGGERRDLGDHDEPPFRRTAGGLPTLMCRSEAARGRSSASAGRRSQPSRVISHSPRFSEPSVLQCHRLLTAKHKSPRRIGEGLREVRVVGAYGRDAPT